MPPRRLVRLITLSLVAVVLVLVLVLPVGSFALGVVPCFVRPDDFNAIVWRATDIDAMCNARVEMVDDLLAGNELRSGRPRAEVERLLGPTEDTDFWLPEDKGLVYVTGCWIDCDWLIVEFDDDQHLVRAYAAQD